MQPSKIYASVHRNYWSRSIQLNETEVPSTACVIRTNGIFKPISYTLYVYIYMYDDKSESLKT